jgi:hypothetical protein
MGRPKSKTEEAQARQARKRRRHLVIAGILGGAVLVGLGTWFVYPNPSLLGAAVPYQGGPRLAVDREEIDFGTVRFGKMVQARFRLKNVGDQPLQIATAPRVEAVEGC